MWPNYKFDMYKVELQGISIVVLTQMFKLCIQTTEKDLVYFYPLLSNISVTIS